MFLDEEVRDVDLHTWPGGPPDGLRDLLRTQGWRVVTRGGDHSVRAVGRDWPPSAETMVGLARLRNVIDCATTAVDDGIPGDFVETGVWRGGTIAALRAVLDATADTTRQVWACDSFEGLPEPDAERYPMDVGMQLHTYRELAVGLDAVKANIARYGLLDERIRFVPGWFRDTLPMLAGHIGPIAVLRLDGDLYESTTDALVNLEPLVSPGGFVVVDDYGGIEACRQAVTDYRAAAGITAAIRPVDWTGVWWRKPPAPTAGVRAAGITAAADPPGA